jgi:hypothetical protein
MNRIGLVALGLMVSASAFATSLNNGTGLSSPAETITFSEDVLPNGTLVTNQWAAFGVTFTGMDYNGTNAGPFPNIDNNDLSNFGSTGTVLANGNPFSMFFTSPQTAVAFALITNPGTSTITAKLGGSTVASFTPGTTFNSAIDFYGFTGITFDEIDVLVNAASTTARIDNLQIGTSAAPEPGAFWLLMTGLAALMGAAAYKRRAQGN